MGFAYRHMGRRSFAKYGRDIVKNLEQLDKAGQVVPPSDEEVRLSTICIRKGIDALIEELKKF